jgi:predicted trehalose synthase
MGTFYHKKHQGEPSFKAMNIWSDARNSCVRLDFQIAYKIFRTLERNYPQSIEVEFLTYLGSQSVFNHFAKLTSVFEYSCKEIPKSNVAIGMCYVQNNGVLFPHFVSLLHRAKFPQKFKERLSLQSWQELKKLTQALGRLLGDFHKAMSLAPRHSDFAPEQFTQSSKESWFKIVSEKLNDRLNKVMSIQKYHTHFAPVFNLLPDYVRKISESISQLDDLGTRIRIHGQIHLGQIILGVNDLVLLDYDADNYDDSSYRRLKQPCLKDFVSIIVSLRFAWYFTERKYYSIQTDDLGNLENDFTSPHDYKFSTHEHKDGNFVSLAELEAIFTRFYKNSLDENVTSMQLRPKSPAKEKLLFNFCFILRILKEIAREKPDGNPRQKMWVLILQDFMTYESTI